MESVELKKYVSELFDNIKRCDPAKNYVCIPILNNENKIVGLLKPITLDYKQMYPECVRLISKWRRENPSLSNSIFEVTDDRTEQWIDRLILDRKDRLFFFIDELDGKHIGHIAFSSFDYENQTAEIDAVLRGEKGNVDGIMTFTIRAMIRWLRENVELRYIQLRVNDDNKRAINLYHRCGFKEVSRIPLYRRELKDEIRWDEDRNRNPSEAERFEFLMRYEENKDGK